MKSKNEDVANFMTEAKSQMWGFSVPFDLAKDFGIRPEIMWYDDGDTSTQTLPSPTWIMANTPFTVCCSGSHSKHENLAKGLILVALC